MVCRPDVNGPSDDGFTGKRSCPGWLMSTQTPKYASPAEVRASFKKLLDRPKPLAEIGAVQMIDSGHVQVAIDDKGKMAAYQIDHYMPAMQDDRLVGAVRTRAAACRSRSSDPDRCAARAH